MYRTKHTYIQQIYIATKIRAAVYQQCGFEMIILWIAFCLLFIFTLSSSVSVCCLFLLCHRQYLFHCRCHYEYLLWFTQCHSLSARHDWSYSTTNIYCYENQSCSVPTMWVRNDYSMNCITGYEWQSMISRGWKSFLYILHVTLQKNIKHLNIEFQV
jgi:hypothetical protein